MEPTKSRVESKQRSNYSGNYSGNYQGNNFNQPPLTEMIVNQNKIIDNV